MSSVRIVSLESLAPRTNCLVGNKRQVAEKVLHSDRERFINEYGAAEKGLKQNVIEKYRLLVDERKKVGG